MLAKRCLSSVLWMIFVVGCSRGGAKLEQDSMDLAPDGSDGAEDGPLGDLAGSPIDGPAKDLSINTDLRPPTDLAPPQDLFSGVLNVRILVSGGCTTTTDPPSYGVTKGSTFTVNWINASAFPVDVAKIDMFNQVPIVIGLEPGKSYHDKVRSWCGMFTGTFHFRASVGPGCSYMMPIRCDL